MSRKVANDLRRGGLRAVEPRKRWRVQPAILALEERRLLSTFTVTSAADTASAASPDVNTLRWAVEQADAATTSSSIEFELGTSPATVTLLQGELTLSNAAHAITMYDGPGEGAVTVSGNSASQVFKVNARVTASLSGITITGGSNYYGSGGGLVNYGTTTLTDCIITGNSAASGAGLFNNNGAVTLNSCTVSGNDASFIGGGVYSYGFGATMVLTNCTVSGNTGSFLAGGVTNIFGTATLTNCTVSGNSTGYNGGGLYSYYGQNSLTNTIVAGNSSDSGPSDIGGYSSVSGSYNLIGIGGSGGLTNGNNNNLVGVADPGLAPLGDYGGPTETMALLPGSPAIDAGTSGPGISATDQRGARACRTDRHRRRREPGIHAHRCRRQHPPDGGNRYRVRQSTRRRGDSQQSTRTRRWRRRHFHRDSRGQRCLGVSVGLIGRDHRRPGCRHRRRPTTSMAIIPSTHCCRAYRQRSI